MLLALDKTRIFAYLRQPKAESPGSGYHRQTSEKVKLIFKFSEKIFPVRVWQDAGKWQKRPVTRNGHHDRKPIGEWSDSEWPDGAVPAYVPADSGLVVIDVDHGHPPEWVTANLPPTRRVRTASGAEHWLYRCDEVLSNSGAGLPAHIDVRSGNGWCPMPDCPGSPYVTIDAREPAPLPHAVRAVLRTAGEAAQHKSANYADEDAPEWIDRARAWLATVPPTSDGWPIAAALVRNFGLTDDGAKELWNEWQAEFTASHRGPDPAPEQWADSEIDIRLESARRPSGTRRGDGVAFELPSARPAAEWVPRPDRHTAAWWGRRELPPRDKLIGPITAGSRGMLIAPSGLGKTNFALAIAAALASGTGIFTNSPLWTAPSARNVLYIDGEMPPQLMRRRIGQAVSRAGGEVGERLIVESWYDWQDGGWLPLNSPGGQEFFEERIADATPALVTLDNLYSLMPGDLKESGEKGGWSLGAQWRRSLTRRNIAQLWVHHANQDGSSYGDKVREWEMDYVISLRRVEDAPPAELVFDIEFSKAREREHGVNGSEYLEGRVKLQGELWRFQDAAERDCEPIEAVLRQHGTDITTAELKRRLGVSNSEFDKMSKKWSRYMRAGTDQLWGLPN